MTKGKVVLPMGAGLAIGIAIGVGMGNVALGIPVGIALGGAGWLMAQRQEQKARTRDVDAQRR